MAESTSQTDVKQSQKQIGPQSAQRLLPAPAGSKTAYKASHSPYSKTPVAEKASSASRPAAAKPATPPYKPRAAGKGVDFLAIEGKGDKSKGSVASSKGVDFLGIGDKAAATKPSTNRSTTGPSKYQPSTRRSASSSAGGSNASARPSTSKPVQFF